MKIKHKFSLHSDIPSSSQSDMAFLLIIFFIVTAVFFERTGIIFQFSGPGPIQVSEQEFIRIHAYNDRLEIDSAAVDYNDIYITLAGIKQQKNINIAQVYFDENLKYGNFIRIFQDIKKTGDMKVSVKPMP